MKRMRVLLFAGLVAAAACSDSANQPTDPTKTPPRSTTTTTATCDPSTIDQAALREALENLFVDGSPDESAGLGKLDNVFHHLNNNRLSVAQEHGWSLLDFIFDKRRAGAILAM